MSLAKAFVTGTVVKEPEKRFTQNDLPIAGFTINIDKNAQTLIRVTAFGQLADAVAATVALNDTVIVEGKLQVNAYKTPSGKEKRVYEISASAVEKTSGANDTQPAIHSQDSNIVSFNQEAQVEELIDEDEIPF